jgi:hypothetical protein
MAQCRVIVSRNGEDSTLSIRANTVHNHHTTLQSTVGLNSFSSRTDIASNLSYVHNAALICRHQPHHDGASVFVVNRIDMSINMRTRWHDNKNGASRVVSRPSCPTTTVTNRVRRNLSLQMRLPHRRRTIIQRRMCHRQLDGVR